MTQNEQDALIAKFMQALDSRRSIDEKTHAKHHNFVEILIERERRKTERWEAVKTHIAKWGVIGFISAALFGLWLYAKDAATRGA